MELPAHCKTDIVSTYIRLRRRGRALMWNFGAIVRRVTTLLCLICATATQATNLTASPADYLAKLTTLQPGDVLDLQAGEYTGGLPVYALNGNVSAPIVIRGPASGARAVFDGTTT